MTESWTRELGAAWLRRPGPHDHKYTRGVLGVRTGSSQYPGAAVLGVSAALGTGIGMVRFVPAHDAPPPDGLPTPAAAVLAAHPEAVCAAGRADAWLIGSGTDPALRDAAETAELREVLRGDAPVVVDAGALDLVPDLGPARAPLILTPHAGEFDRLWEQGGLEPLDAPTGRAPLAVRVERSRRLARALGAAVLLKGPTSVCAAPDGRVHESGPATPWLATAGTGDVLAGVLGALVAARADAVRADPGLLAEAGATAARVHDAAARLAAGDPSGDGSGIPITAGQLAAALPRAAAR
ncbi:NAD(P)H-hydrate dehydratase [Leucobacter zeae]|nr:NAD(P)H-hydrate dehydratase [Leucobacter zeae]